MRIGVIRPFLFSVASTFLLAGQTFAHRPYEHVVASFTRSDGVVVSVVEHYVDGILGADPVCVQFRLPDGTVIAHTDYSPDGVIVRSKPLAVEVYRFKTDWVPIASSVQQFDGYSLTDIMTPSKRLVSPLLHTCEHWIAYVVALGFAVLFFVGWLGTIAIPKRGRLATLRVFGFVCVAFAANLYLAFIVLVAPVSPPILLLLTAICLFLCLSMRRFIRLAKAA